MRYESGMQIYLGCGVYALDETPSGHLKAAFISKDPECVKKVKKELKRRTKEAKKK